MLNPREIEVERVRTVERNKPELGRYVPGSFGCHEALHTVSIVVGLVGADILEHGAIVSNREWYALAHEAHDALYRLYQVIGAAHLDAPYVGQS